MNLASLLDKGVVKVPLEGLTTEEVIAELVELMVLAGKVKDRQAVLDALYERENKGSTGIGGGVAIPHARHPEIEGIVLAAGVSRDGIEFFATDGEPVYMVFLLMATPDRPDLNVETLADIGSLVQVPGIYQKLVNAQDASELTRIIAKAQQEQ